MHNKHLRAPLLHKVNMQSYVMNAATKYNFISKSAYKYIAFGY